MCQARRERQRGLTGSSDLAVCSNAEHGGRSLHEAFRDDVRLSELYSSDVSELTLQPFLRESGAAVTVGRGVSTPSSDHELGAGM